MCRILLCASVWNIIRYPDSAIQKRIQIGQVFKKNSAGSDMDIQTALITAVIRVYLGYGAVWIKYFDRYTGLGSDRIAQ